MDRSLVKGNKLVPAPPSITIASVFFSREFEFIFGRGSKSLFSTGLFSRAPKTLCHYSASASSSQRRRRRYGAPTPGRKGTVSRGGAFHRDTGWPRDLLSQKPCAQLGLRAFRDRRRGVRRSEAGTTGKEFQRSQLEPSDPPRRSLSFLPFRFQEPDPLVDVGINRMIRLGKITRRKQGPTNMLHVVVADGVR